MSGPALVLRGALQMGATRLIDAVDITCPAGKWTALLGASGVGKSTLGRLIADLPGPQVLNGEATAPKRVAVMAQDAHLLPWASALDNVTLGAKLRGERTDIKRAEALLAQVGLAGLEGRKPNALSGGQRQRVALARTLMEDCPVVVLDEPFSALDAATRLAMQSLAAQVLAARTVLLITHDPLEAARLADVAYLVTREGTEALELPTSETPRAFNAAEVLATQAALLARLRGVAA